MPRHKLPPLFREVIWIAGIAVVSYLIALVLRRWVWLGAFWVFPMPHARGPVWVNFNSLRFIHTTVFMLLAALTYLIRLILHLIRKKAAASMH